MNVGTFKELWTLNNKNNWHKSFRKRFFCFVFLRCSQILWSLMLKDILLQVHAFILKIQRHYQLLKSSRNTHESSSFCAVETTGGIIARHRSHIYIRDIINNAAIVVWCGGIQNPPLFNPPNRDPVRSGAHLITGFSARSWEKLIGVFPVPLTGERLTDRKAFD